MLHARIRNSFSQLPFLIRALGFVWIAAKWWTLAWVVLLIIQGLLPVATVYLTRYLVNTLVASTEAGLSIQTVQAVLVPVILFALILLLGAGLTSLINWIRTEQAERVQDYMSGLVHKKSYAVDLAFYDSPDFFDHLHRARTDASYRPVALLEAIGSLIQNGITMVSMTIILLPFGWWVPVALVVSTIPIFYVVLQHRLRLYQWRMKNTPIERKTWYYEWLLTERETAAELRLFQLGDLFNNRFLELRKILREERTSLARSQATAELAASAASLLVTGIAMAWMLIQTISGIYNLGDMAFFYQAFIQGQTLARSFLENVGEIYSNSLFLSDMFEFLALEANITQPGEPDELPTSLEDGIEFDQVDFAYPGSARQALNSFSMYVPAGQFVAIVGPNGAGKSTLIRLLCRFYDPQAGRILFDHKDIRQFGLDKLRNSITVLFQDPVQYNTSAAENIALGDLASDPTQDQIIHAAIAAGADEPISRLPDQYNTLLGKWFEGGAELSVGEWQRLALARAFLRKAQIVILDEPTSAMDPWAETEWLGRFRAITAEKTAILITHRFTTAAHADKIHVMQDGQIVESGSHLELLAAQGLYAQSWQKQMQSWAA